MKTQTTIALKVTNHQTEYHGKSWDIWGQNLTLNIPQNVQKSDFPMSSWVMMSET